MEKKYFHPETDGFYGVYYPNPKPCQNAMIAMLGDSSDDHMVVSGVKWLHHRGCNVMAMSPGKKDYGHHDYPLERMEKAIAYLKAAGNKKIGIVWASTTGMDGAGIGFIVPGYYSHHRYDPAGFYHGRLHSGRQGRCGGAPL